MVAVENRYNTRSRQPKKRSWARLVIFLFLMAVIGALGFFSMNQHAALQSLENNLQSLEEQLNRVEEEKSRLEEQYDQLYEENEKLREENKMMRSETLIEHGDRETNKVAITIDDGGTEAINNLTLDYLKEYGVRATLFPTGINVESYPETWRRAVEEGHELGNHSYSHPYLTNLSEEQVRAELSRWQEAVEEAVGRSYHTPFFRPPYGDGFYSGQSYHRERLQPIVAEKGMFPIMWDVELVYALRNQAYSSDRIVEHVLNQAQGGSIVLLHFTEADIKALPRIINGLRERGLEPCSLRELLLAEPQT